jgi:archaellum biogenesis protein FlaJ (TadC family)
MKNLELWLSLVFAVVLALVIAIWVPGDPEKKVMYAMEYGALIITFLFGFLVLAAIASGRIDISRLLEEKGSGGGDTRRAASMSRFQFLIFTFVVAISLLIIVISGEPRQFPKDIPVGVLTLVGISASTYAVSKGIQASSSNGDGIPTSDVPAGAVTHTTVVAPAPIGGTVTHTTVVSPPATA